MADEQTRRLTPQRLIKLFIVLFIVLAVPLITLILGQITRKQIKADVACKSPPIPDPVDCVAGEWIINKDVNGCIHFVCVPLR